MSAMKRKVATPPDGGWGWVVVACAFVNHFFCAGLAMSLGVFYVYWLEEFQQAKGITSWIISILFFLMCVIGPLPASLAGRYGFRVVSAVGSCLMSLGLFLSYFATSVLFLIGTVGILAGTGIGFVYLSSFATVALYFDKRRTLANGLSSTGGGIAAFVMPQMIRTLEEMYGWRGALWIMSGLVLNMCATALLLRLPDDNDGRKPNFVSGEVDDSTESDLDCSLPILDLEKIEGMGRDVTVLKISLNDKEEGGGELCEIVNVEAVKNDEEETRRLYPASSPVKDRPASNDDDVAYTEINKEQLACSKEPLKAKNILFKNVIPVSQFGSAPHIGKPISSSRQEDSTEALMKRSNGKDGNIFSSVDGFFPDKQKRQVTSSSTNVIQTNSLQNIDATVLGSMPSLFKVIYSSISSLNNSTPQKSTRDANHSQNGTTTGPFNNMVKKDVEGDPILSENSIALCRKGRTNGEDSLSIDSSTPMTFMQNIHAYIQLLKDWRFLTFAICCFTLNVAVTICLVYIVDRAVEQGLGSSVGSMVMSCNGIGNIFGRLFFGVMTDRLFKDHVICFMLILATMGVASILSVFCGDIAVLHYLYAVIFGATLGGHVVLMLSVTVTLIGLDRATLALGLNLAFVGSGDLIGPPMGGWIYDITGTYLYSFLLAGILLLVSSAMLFPIRKK